MLGIVRNYPHQYNMGGLFGMLHPLCVATWIFGSAYSILFLMFDYSTYELHCIATAATNSSWEMPLSASYLEGWKHSWKTPEPPIDSPEASRQVALPPDNIPRIISVFTKNEADWFHHLLGGRKF